MKKKKSDQSALAVLKRITHQEGLLAQTTLFESMSKLRKAEDDQASLVTRLDQHQQSLAENWRTRAAHALLMSLSTVSYRNWLKAEIVDAKSNVDNLSLAAESAKDHEAQLRAEGRLLQEVLDRREQRGAQDLERRVFKEMDEAVLLRARSRSDEQ
ncbi:MAG TPA: hypothetical protein VFW00_13305 [Rhodocyclaceae bacterium]|nr:hypothetical protein [Rhodocyclaceae bacterium]